jgi:hypothetical protein
LQGHFCEAINIEAARSAGQRKLRCLQVLQTSLKILYHHPLLNTILLRNFV